MFSNYVLGIIYNIEFLLFKNTNKFQLENQNLYFFKKNA